MANTYTVYTRDADYNEEYFDFNTKAKAKSCASKLVKTAKENKLICVDIYTYDTDERIGEECLYYNEELDE